MSFKPPANIFVSKMLCLINVRISGPTKIPYFIITLDNFFHCQMDVHSSASNSIISTASRNRKPVAARAHFDSCSSTGRNSAELWQAVLWLQMLASRKRHFLECIQFTGFGDACRILSMTEKCNMYIGVGQFRNTEEKIKCNH